MKIVRPNDSCELFVVEATSDGVASVDVFIGGMGDMPYGFGETPVEDGG